MGLEDVLRRLNPYQLIKNKVSDHSMRSLVSDLQYITGSDETVEKAIEAIKGYRGETAKIIADTLNWIAKETGSKEDVEKAAEVYQMKSIKETINMYGGEIAKEIASRLTWVALTKGGKEAVEKVAEVYQMKSIKETINMYSSEIAKEIANDLGLLAFYTSKEDVEKAAEVIKIYDGRTARYIAFTLNQIAFYSQIKGQVKDVEEAIKIIKKYNGWVAKGIAEYLRWVASKSFGKDTEKAVEIFKNTKLGKYIIMNILDYDFYKYLDFIKENKIEGATRVMLGDICGIDPKEINFSDHVKEILNGYYGITAELTIGELKYVVPSYIKLTEERDSFVKAINLIGNGKYWRNEKVRKILKEMEKYGVNIDGLKGESWVYRVNGEQLDELNIQEDELIKQLTVYLIGKNEEKIREAEEVIRKIENEKKLRQARGMVRSNRKIRQKIFKLYEEDNFEEILNTLEEYASSSNKKSREALHDLVHVVKGYLNNKIRGDHLVGFYGKQIASMFSNNSTMCCALLPRGENRYAAVTYQLDPRIITIGYSFIDELKKGKEIEAVREKGELDGLVIGYVGLNGDKPILLVDSVEGGRAFRNWMEKNYKRIIEDVRKVARKIGIKTIIYNAGVYNKTPQRFNKKVRRAGYKAQSVEVNRIGDAEIPYDYTEDGKQYLEAFGGWNVPGGKVEGYLYEIN